MTNIAPPAAFLEQLAQQRADYAASLPGKVDAVERLWRVVASGTEAHTGLQCLQRAVHGLAGSGGIFGFGELSAAARALERELRDVLDAGAASVASREAVAAAIARLRDCTAGTT